MHGHRDSAAEAPFALALAAGLFREPDGERFRALLSERGNANIHPSYLELTIVLSSRGVSNVAAIVDAVLAGLRIEIPPLTPSQARIEAADAVLVVTPEYNGSVPGQLRNAIDRASRTFDTNPLRGKNVAVIGASAGGGGARSAIAGAQRILARTGATVIKETFALAQLDESGVFGSPEIEEQVTSVVTALASRSRGDR